MEVIILAGGKGERLKSAVKNVPKVMADVNGKPFLEYVLKWLVEEKTEKIIISVGYMAEKIQNYFGSSYNGTKIIYSKENAPLGTGGAIKKALSVCESEKALVINGDTYFPIDLNRFFKESQNCDVSIALKRVENSERYATVKKNNKNIISFKEKKNDKCGLINGGIYCIKKDILTNMPNVFSMEKDYFEKFVGKINIRGIEFFNYFIDIGVPEDYRKVQNILGKKPKAVFFDRDGTLNFNIPHLCDKEKLQFIDERAKLVKYYNDNGFLVIVVTNQAGIAKGLYSVSDLEDFHKFYNKKLEKEFGAHIDKFYYCPHHPDFDGECECRKPKSGMLLKAIEDFGIDTKKSVLYGDKPWDIEAGNSAGIKSILVESYGND